MRRYSSLTAAASGSRSFMSMLRRLGESFTVRDVMVPRDQIVYVGPGNFAAATQIISQKNFSVVPVSGNGKNFESVFESKRPHDSARRITEERKTDISDYIPDSTPLAEALTLFEGREWYFTLRGNKVTGLITYWDFNSREFRVQMYVVLSHLEELSRDILAKDGCGLSGPDGLNLTTKVLAKVGKRFEASRKDLGGNRFVDELDFHHVHDSLSKHSLWRKFLNQRTGKTLSTKQYDKLYGLTKLRDAVMHGRVLFPTYRHFKQGTNDIEHMIELIDHLDAYHSSPSL